MNYPPRTRFTIQFAAAPDSGFSIIAPIDAFEIADFIDRWFPGATGFWTIYPDGQTLYGDI